MASPHEQDTLRLDAYLLFSTILPHAGDEVELHPLGRPHQRNEGQFGCWDWVKIIRKMDSLSHNFGQGFHGGT